MRPMKLACAAAIVALIPMATSPALAEEPLTYNGALTCSSLYTILAVGQVEEGDAEAAALLQDFASKWLVMAMARDESDGDKALGEFDARFDSIIDAVNEMSEHEVEPFLTGMVERCDVYEVANAEEFRAIELD